MCTVRCPPRLRRVFTPVGVLLGAPVGGNTRERPHRSVIVWFFSIVVLRCMLFFSFARRIKRLHSPVDLEFEACARTNFVAAVRLCFGHPREKTLSAGVMCLRRKRFSSHSHIQEGGQPYHTEVLSPLTVLYCPCIPRLRPSTQNHKLEQLVAEMKGAPQSAAQVGGWLWRSRSRSVEPPMSPRFRFGRVCGVAFTSC